MNINNVYDEVAFFFSDDLDLLPVFFDREMIEGFLRQKAWQGMQDAELRDVWGNLKMFLAYLSYSGNMDIEEINCSEYSLIIEWISVQMEFTPSLETVRRFFEVLDDFYNYLGGRKFVVDIAIKQLRRANDLMTGGKSLEFIEPDHEFNPFEKTDENSLTHIHRAIPEDISKMIGEAVERLMLKFSSYFQREEFVDDFDRALMLYVGPAGDAPEENEKKDDNNEFWLGFWDYFLFDYHLLKNDMTPLEKFNMVYQEKISLEEKKILNDLMDAKFTVFYISKIINQDWVQCVNLFTQENFRLPNPNFDYRMVKKMLFFGHVFFQQEGQELVMINFITSVEISLNLRKRIKEEVERQKAIFNIQTPSATWEEFFKRHANIVRHTIDLLVTCAKVNVTPHTYTERIFPAVPVENQSFEKISQHPVSLEVADLIERYMPKLTYSRYDVVLAKKLWHDYCQLTEGEGLDKIRNLPVWAASVIYTYAKINADVDSADMDVLGKEMSVKKSSVKQTRNKIVHCLELRQFDPRYVSEEGFLYLLYQQ